MCNLCGGIWSPEEALLTTNALGWLIFRVAKSQKLPLKSEKPLQKQKPQGLNPALGYIGMQTHPLQKQPILEMYL